MRHVQLRIPEDGRDYPLPPSLGKFPIVSVSDYKDKVALSAAAVLCRGVLCCVVLCALRSS